MAKVSKEKKGIGKAFLDEYKPNFEYDKLPENFKKDWVGSLRSGNYVQIEGSLIEKDEKGKECYCVLDVAGDVCGVAHKTLERHSQLTLIKNTKAWKIPKELKGNEELQSLMIQLNDDRIFTFDEFADWIEYYL